MAHLFAAPPQPVTLSAYEPFPIISSTSFSSNAPASAVFVPWIQPNAIAIKNIVIANSLNASAAAASSQNSSGSAGYSYSLGATVFRRQDYAANSTNMTTVASASVGVSASMSYSSSSQSYGLSWVTDSTGGTTSFSTTSGSNNWTSFATGPKLISIPFVTTLGAGEYFMAFQQSSTAATSGSAVTLLSLSQLQQAWPVVTVGTLGGSVTIASINPDGAGCGVASGVTTNNTMALSAISVATENLIYFALSNAT